MGSDKALLVWRGQTLLEHARLLLRDAGCATVRVVGRRDEPGGIADAEPFAGPARALLDAVCALGDEAKRLLVVPVDMPRLGVTDLAPLLDQDGAMGCHYQDQPLPFMVACTALADVSRQTRSIRSLLSAVGAHTIGLPASRMSAFSNVNTLEDYGRLNV